jgi:hypothetical protein
MELFLEAVQAAQQAEYAKLWQPMAPAPGNDWAFEALGKSHIPNFTFLPWPSWEHSSSTSLAHSSM